MKKNLSRKAIRNDLFKSNVLLSCVIIIIFGIFFSGILYYSGISNTYDLLEQRNKAITSFIDSYFSKFFISVKILANNKKIQNAPIIGSKNHKDILALYKFFKDTNLNIKYIYSAYKNGALIINNYVPPKGYNPVIRPWYQMAVKSAPRISPGLPYQDIKNEEWLVSIGKVLTDSKKKVTGVIGIDTSIKKIVNLLKNKQGKYKSSYSFVLRTDGVIIIHHIKKYLSKNISKLFESPVKFDKANGEFEYMLNGISKLAFYSRIDELGWIIVTVIEKKEVTLPIIIQIVLSVLMIVFTAISLGWFLGVILSKKFTMPLVELKKRISNIIGGHSDNLSDYEYPNNEIGVIATDIEQFTKSKLHDKNMKLQALNMELESISIELSLANEQIEEFSQTKPSPTNTDHNE